MHADPQAVWQMHLLTMWPLVLLASPAASYCLSSIGCSFSCCLRGSTGAAAGCSRNGPAAAEGYPTATIQVLLSSVWRRLLYSCSELAVKRLCSALGDDTYAAVCVMSR